MNETTTVVRTRPIAVPRVWARDGVFVALSIAHACALVVLPSIPVIAIGLWWNANTIAHNFIHRPFFRSRWANRAFSAFLSLVLGVPQRLWRARHLAHHAELTSGRAPVRWTPAMFVEAGLVLAMWAVVAMVLPRFFLTVYLPGWAIGLGLCFLQGHFEHERGTTSHYGRLYNALFFNDGYHVEHHARPGALWADLPAHATTDAPASRWPAVLRWLDWFTLDALERLVLRSPMLQRFVVSTHERAMQRLLSPLPPVTRVAIVGGGLFPRTALILRRLLPDASLVVIDANAENLALAKARLERTQVREYASAQVHEYASTPVRNIEYRHERWDPRQAEAVDLVIVPLAFQGDRRRVYQRPAAPAVIVHDWMWHRRGTGTRVAWLLCKRLNLVRR